MKKSRTLARITSCKKAALQASLKVTLLHTLRRMATAPGSSSGQSQQTTKGHMKGLIFCNLDRCWLTGPGKHSQASASVTHAFITVYISWLNWLGCTIHTTLCINNVHLISSFITGLHFITWSDVNITTPIPGSSYTFMVFIKIYACIVMFWANLSEVWKIKANN